MTLQIGETVEIKGYRLSRWVQGLDIFELRNAGKRGKKVRQWSVSCWKDPAKIDDAVDQALRQIEFFGGEGLAESLASCGLTVNVDDRRGIDIRPAGFETIRIYTPQVAIEVDWDSFTVHDLLDGANQPKAIDRDGDRRSVARMRAWTREHAQGIAGMNFLAILRAMRSAGIDYHEYFAMD